jgi:hypothetical protein
VTQGESHDRGHRTGREGGPWHHAPGFSLFQFAPHVLLPGTIAAMILGPASAIWARRSPAKVPLIIGGAVVSLLLALALKDGCGPLWGGITD